MQSLSRAFWSLCFACTLAGCVPTLHVDVSAINDGGPKLIGSYAIEAGSDQVSDRDLVFREVASLVEIAMDERGYTRVSPDDEPDLYLLVDFAISDGQLDIDTIPAPARFRTGVTFGRGGPYGRYGTFGYDTFYDERIVVREVFDSFLWLDAIEARSWEGFIAGTDEPEPLWQLSAVATSQTRDLRRLMPFLVFAARDYIGEDTGRARRVTVSADEYGFELYSNEY